MISGGTPATAKLTKRASGFTLYFFSAFSLISTTAAAPSDICELLPAVTLPRAAKTVRSFASVSGVVSVRGPSSVSATRLRRTTWPLARSGIPVSIS